MAEERTIVTDYRLSEFSYEEARLGALCAVVVNTINPASYDEVRLRINGGIDICLSAKGITRIQGNEETATELTLGYKGKGICRMIKSGNLCITLKSVDYIFNGQGFGVSNNSLGYKLLMLTLDETSNEAASAIPWSGYGTTRGVIDTEPSAEPKEDINIVGMSARDEFANQALRGILSRIEDPFSLSDNEISYYCEAAYKWASVMMLVAANSRDKEDTSTQETTAAQITSLDSNIERLLNNILVAITENSSGSGGGSGTVSVQNTEDSNHNAVPLVISGNTTVNINSGNNNPLYVSIVDNS